jgi:hypothetical protein
MMSKAKAISRKKLIAFVSPIEQNLLHGNPIKPNMTVAEAPPWPSQMKKPLRLCYSAYLRMAAKQSAAFFVEASGERFRKNRES